MLISYNRDRFGEIRAQICKIPLPSLFVLTYKTMLKLLRPVTVLYTGLILVAAPVAFSQITNANPRQLTVSDSNADKPSCYMQTAQGRTLYLDSMCGKLNGLSPRTNQNSVADRSVTTNTQLSEAEIKHLIDETCQTQKQCPSNLSNVDVAVVKPH